MNFRLLNMDVTAYKRFTLPHTYSALRMERESYAVTVIFICAIKKDYFNSLFFIQSKRSNS